MNLIPEWRDTNPDLLDTNDRTPLLYATVAKREREGIVKIFLESADVKHDSADADGRTPLLYAATRGYHPAVMLLLGRNPTNRHPQRTGGVVNLLSESRHFDPHSNTRTFSRRNTPGTRRKSTITGTRRDYSSHNR